MDDGASRRSPGADETPAEYVRRVLEALGDRDPLEVQAVLVDRLRDAVAGMSDEQLREREAPGRWSALEVIRHLADTEMVYSYRMRMSVAQPGSAMPAYDQDRWATELRYNEDDPERALRELEALRSANLAWLATLSDEELDRAGVHEERGRESVRRSIELLAAHDLVHREQVERIKSAVL